MAREYTERELAQRGQWRSQAAHVKDQLDDIQAELKEKTAREKELLQQYNGLQEVRGFMGGD